MVFIAGLVVGVIANTFFHLWIWGAPWDYMVGGILLILGVWLSISAGRAFRKHNTPTEPWKPTSQLVQDGPYKFSRNPIYLSFAVFYVGLAIIFNSIPALIILVPLIIAFDRTQVQREERYLDGRFGEDYRSYKKKVRRWI